MIYIDIDGVLADSDGYLQTKDSRAMDDTHLLFKTIYKYHETVFKDSKPLVDLDFLKNIGDFMLLSALPNRQNIDSFCATEAETNKVMFTLEENKKDWIKRNISPECKFAIVGATTDKIRYCLSSEDILIDDNKKTGKRWQEKGGKWFSSVKSFLSGDSASTRGRKSNEAAVKAESNNNAGYAVDLW